jgi:hypothetical protein
VAMLIAHSHTPFPLDVVLICRPETMPRKLGVLDGVTCPQVSPAELNG